jgi:lipopolysaccharide/colanic/teichoic acid biosynthesis glycosyltransferase
VHRFTPDLPAKINELGDCAALTAAAVYATGQAREAAVVATLAVGGWLLAARGFRQYDVSSKESVAGNLARTSVIVVAVAITLALARVVASPLLARASVVRFLVLAWPAALALRLAARRARAARDARHAQVLIVGSGALGRVTGEDLSFARGTKLVGYLRFLEDADGGAPLPAKLLGTVEHLASVLESRDVSEVFIAGHAVRCAAAMQTAIRTCERYGVPFALPAHRFRFGRARAVNLKSAKDGYVHYSTVEAKPVQLALRRAFDILLSAVALWLLAPLLVGTAVAVKLTSRGPALFKQQRIGMRGRPFHMLKFRSMVANAEQLKARARVHDEQTRPVFKMTADPRVTRLGRFLRKYSLDELPQLINVLRGEMSMVGPRPPLPSEVVSYEPWQRRRLARPGLTRFGQIARLSSGRRPHGPLCRMLPVSGAPPDRDREARDPHGRRARALTRPALARRDTEDVGASSSRRPGLT